MFDSGEAGVEGSEDASSGISDKTIIEDLCGLAVVGTDGGKSARSSSVIGVRKATTEESE